jgi:hypothetical protein
MCWWWWRKSRKRPVQSWCAAVHWPVYVEDGDEGTFSVLEDIEAFRYRLDEFNDIVDGMYQGWDSSGYHFVPAWDEEARCSTIHAVSPEPDWAAFRCAAERFCERYKNYRKLRPSDCSPDLLAARMREIMPP